MLRVASSAPNSGLTPSRLEIVQEALTRFVQQEVGRQRRAVEVQSKQLPTGHPDLAVRGWANPDAVAERIVQTAIASAGKAPSEVAAAREAIRRGFALSERILGGLPPVSDETRTLVERKFENLLLKSL